MFIFIAPIHLINAFALFTFFPRYLHRSVCSFHVLLSLKLKTARNAISKCLRCKANENKPRAKQGDREREREKKSGKKTMSHPISKILLTESSSFWQWDDSFSVTGSESVCPILICLLNVFRVYWLILICNSWIFLCELKFKKKKVASNTTSDSCQVKVYCCAVYRWIVILCFKKLPMLQKKFFKKINKTNCKITNWQW